MDPNPIASDATRPGVTTQVMADTQRVDKLMKLQHTRTEFREQLLRRSRTVERDIDSWFAREVEAILDNWHHVVSTDPPATMFDVEPPF